MNDIYQNVILQYAQNPTCKGKVCSKEYNAEVKNPLCGDIIKLGYDFNNDNIIWDGKGCIICLAAAECFCLNAKNKDLEYMKNMIDNILLDYNHNKSSCEEFKAFENIKSIKNRTKCVTLVAKCGSKLIEEYKIL